MLDRRQRRTRNGESGQALVEFAIVAPLIVMVILFSMWFYELVQIKLKVQEAARYATWEATAYPLHDYKKGKGALSQLAQTMTTNVRNDTMQRYSDLDSRSDQLTLNNRIFSASFTPPIVIQVNRQEEVIYGGPIVNLIFGLAGTLFDIYSALTYKSVNPVALSLIALGKDWGGAMTSRMFGDSSWGFNKQGYIETKVTCYVKNEWFNRGVGRYILPNPGVLMMEPAGLTERYGLLADSWQLDPGDDVGGTGTRPGVSSTDYWEQVNRMYLQRSAARSVAKTWISTFRILMNVALGLSMSSASSGIGEQDFTQPSVVARNYRDRDSGRVTVQQDRGQTRQYDTAPVGTKSDKETLSEYWKTLDARGPHFMGCDKEMSLGCPSSTLQQDNPFGGYIHRE